MHHVLKRHPASNGFAAAHVEVDIARPREGHLVFSYIVTGKMGDIRLPPTMPAVRTDNLWQHTCFEAFIRERVGHLVLRVQFFTLDAMGGLSVQRLPQRHARGERGRRAADRGAIRTSSCYIAGRHWSWIACRTCRRDASWRLGLSAVIEEPERPQVVLGVGASAGQAGLPSRRLLCA